MKGIAGTGALALPNAVMNVSITTVFVSNSCRLALFGVSYSFLQLVYAMFILPIFLLPYKRI